MDVTIAHPVCICADWDGTLHIGESYCPGFGGMAAHCAVCLGCKFCRLAAEQPAVAGRQAARRAARGR